MFLRCKFNLFYLIVGLISHLLINTSAFAHNDSDPALVKLLINQNGNKINCKGVAVAHRTILTSAHCLVNITPNAIQVLSNERSLGVSDLKLHPDFSTHYRLPRFDIALLTTNEIITDKPYPIILNTKLTHGENFSIIHTTDKGNLESVSRIENSRSMVVANLERSILNYIELKRGSFPNPQVVEDLEVRIKKGDPKIRQKILDEFEGFIFSLYSESNDSICVGESGSPALVSKNGTPGVIGLATAVSNLEIAQNPECPEGGTSIFTSLSQKETIIFIKKYNPEIVFQ